MAEQHHLVSRGYQQNFANDEKRVAILDTRTARITSTDRPIKNNFTSAGFNSYIDADGSASAWLEREFAKVERPVLDQIRRITVGSPRPSAIGAVVGLMSLHLVRNRAFAEFHDDILDQTRREQAAKMLRDPRLQAMHLKQLGMPASESSVQTMIDDWAEQSIASNSGLVESMSRQYNSLVDKLSCFRVQVISAERLETGFGLGDTPVVHANSGTGQVGFRDRLAVGDADIVMAPLSRWIAVALTARRVPSLELRTKKALQRINAATIRAADAEVACHPDDSRELRRVCEHLADYPLARLVR